MSPDAGATTQGPNRIHKMWSTIILVEFKHKCLLLFIEDFERFSLGFGVVEVNSDKIDDGEVTKDFEDFEKDFKIFKNFIVL